MSHFATELEALMEEKKINSAAELSKLSGVDQATISRVRSGVQQISHEDLDRISRALGPTPSIHARLLAARLREELRPPSGSRIEISLQDGELPPGREKPVSYASKLTPKNQKILDTLANNIEDTELRSILQSLATLCDKGSLSGRLRQRDKKINSKGSDAKILGSMKKHYPLSHGGSPQK